MKALIYCRVSSQRQVDEGSGLSSQLQRCREYCRVKGYEVAEVFSDEGVSGGLFDRPEMNSLLTYIDNNASEKYVVVFDDLKRFARDIEVHLRLRREFDSRGVKIESPNFNFEDTEESRYVEGILALTAQLERGQNRKQVMQKQKARLEQGYWPFCNPPGLKFIGTKEDGKLLVPDEVLAPIYKEMIEGYANGFIKTQTEATEFLRSKYAEKSINRKISNHGVNRILREILYTNYIEYLPWNVSLRPAKHKGFISMDTYKKVQDRLAGINKTKPRKNYLEDFALRGFIYCPSCGKPYTASWNTGRNKKYPNYTCKTSACEFRWKSISKTNMHKDFRALLTARPLDPDFAHLAEAVLVDTWNSYKEKELTRVNILDTYQAEYSKQIDNLVNLISKTADASVIDTYQVKIKELKMKLIRVDISDVCPAFEYTTEKFGTALKKVLQTLENPLSVWKTNKVDVKRNLINFYFDEPLIYDKKNGFGTVEFRREININSGLKWVDNSMVEMAGIEPAY